MEDCFLEVHCQVICLLRLSAEVIILWYCYVWFNLKFICQVVWVLIPISMVITKPVFILSFGLLLCVSPNVIWVHPLKNASLKEFWIPSSGEWNKDAPPDDASKLKSYSTITWKRWELHGHFTTQAYGNYFLSQGHTHFHLKRTQRIYALLLQMFPVGDALLGIQLMLHTFVLVWCCGRQAGCVRRGRGLERSMGEVWGGHRWRLQRERLCISISRIIHNSSGSFSGGASDPFNSHFTQHTPCVLKSSLPSPHTDKNV